MRRLRKVPVIAVFSLLLLLTGSGGLHFPPIDLAAAPYKYDLLTWELTHLPDKWLHKLKSLLPWNSQNLDERRTELQDFFLIGEEIRALERELAELSASPSHAEGEADEAESPDRSKNPDHPQERLRRLGSARSSLKARVEETLESELSAVLSDEGFSSRIGLIFPPVDLALSRPPMVLVVSPRDRIARIKTVLLKPGMKEEDMEALEEKIFQETDLSALVTGIGGVATYPTIVRGDSSLIRAAELGAHEWLHIYWFFRPLGWSFWSWTPQMNTLNETAATLAGRELGDMVYTAITGKEVEPVPFSDLSQGEADMAPQGQAKPDEAGFDFNREMRETRLRTEELLAQGKVEEAESYMEERLRLFVENGTFIRKINQAFFAFFGSYADSPASVSPVGDEVQQLRSTTSSVGEFIRTMSGFGSYREFKDHLSSLPGTAGLEQQPDQAVETGR